jgi:hypothetical protein
MRHILLAYHKGNINSKSSNRRVARLLLALMLLLPVLALRYEDTHASPPQQANSKLVLAFYYMWFSPENFKSGQMSDTPVTPYNSSDPAVIERQVREAKGAGIDGFIAAWTGTGTDTDKNFAKLLDTAAAQGFKAAIHFETHTVANGGDVAGQIPAAIAKYGNHPAYLRWNNKPVIFFWSPQTVGNAKAWSDLRKRVDPNNSQMWSVDTTEVSYLDAFDSIHLFSAGKWTASTDTSRIAAEWRGKVDTYNKSHGTSRLWAAGVIPGWDESRVQPPRNPAKVFPRRDGAEYEANWRGATASKPDLITITSFNEWYEGTQIEPSVSAGAKYLDITRKQTNLWKNGPDPCEGGTFFKETNLSICKPMESYWNKFGGLAQFGYPISPARQEKSSIDGKTYTVQYFERALFELHLENAGTPYEVQLALLGRTFHKVDPPAAQINDGRHQYFKETGHNVLPEFAHYWQAHGGLFVNGFPISEPLQERAADGKTYTVQYFERARFELHQENAPPYDVLLGHLGRQALKP